MLRFIGQFCVVVFALSFFIFGFAALDETIEEPMPSWNPAVSILLLIGLAIESKLHRLVKLRELEALSEADRERQYKDNRRFNNLLAGLVLVIVGITGGLVFAAVLVNQ